MALAALAVLGAGEGDADQQAARPPVRKRSGASADPDDALATLPSTSSVGPPDPLETRAGTWLRFIGCAAAFLALCWILRDFVTDDAWITARYAANLAQGHGLVWNPSGARVEGFSNPLLVLAEALGVSAGVPSVLVARGLGVVSGLALLGLIQFSGRRVLGDVSARTGLLLTALFPPFALWAVGGLESIPAALALTGGVLALCAEPAGRRSALTAGAAFSTLPWLRPEGIVAALAVAVSAEAPGLVRGPRRAALARLARITLPVAASQGLLETFRLVAYGHLLPNSVIYKAGSGGTFDVVAKLVAVGGPVLVAAAVGACVTRDRRRLLAVAPLVYALGSLRMMDSADAFARFFIPVWPQIALLAGLALAAARRRVSRSGRAPRLALAAATALLVTSAIAVLPAIAGFGSRYAQCKQRARGGAADWIRAHTDPGDTLAISDSGLVPASADRTAIDQFMLNDPLLQRTGRLPVAQRVANVYRARPEVLVLASRRPDRFAGLYATDRAMARATEFRRYRRAAVSRGHGGGCDYHLVISVRR